MKLTIHLHVWLKSGRVDAVRPLACILSFRPCIKFILTVFVVDQPFHAGSTERHAVCCSILGIS